MLVTAPYVVDEHVEPPIFVTDAAEKRFDIRVNCVVAADGNAAAAAVCHFAGSTRQSCLARHRWSVRR